MSKATTLFARVMADVFVGKPPVQPSQASAAPHARQADPEAPAAKPVHNEVPSVSTHVVGQGASNETVVTIGDIPHLFVDEGDHVVQFSPAFDDHAEETEFGLKILPDLTPHWSQRAVHRCPLKEAVAAAIRQNGKPQPVNPSPQSKEVAGGTRDFAGGSDEAFEPETVRQARPRRAHHVDSSNVVGRIVSWGEERFPDRKRPGRFYESFAMHVDTSDGERTLQGEGLKDAIAECRCVVGDVVSVRRTGKVKVPAIRADGSAILKDGKPVLWDKWLWAISK
ncbi:hypothetical protein [Paraburkholderia hospita]|jgi:hypothetical protein|uniref:hypothetical protein n=1 Tax=Paraburkholderia hospita TaxID=169430 RepID=UPI0008A7637B|nr:hypothetical protein [Paraburkholderia hospita]SEI23783.1 hypothetical protein SAMN05192544_104944 [Paraburkholderia hospita]